MGRVLLPNLIFEFDRRITWATPGGWEPELKYWPPECRPLPRLLPVAAPSC